MFDRLKEKLATWVAWHLPRDVVKWCMIRTFAHASTGQWGGEHVDQIGYKEVHDRWEQRHV